MLRLRSATEAQRPVVEWRFLSGVEGSRNDLKRIRHLIILITYIKSFFIFYKYTLPLPLVVRIMIE